MVNDPLLVPPAPPTPIPVEHQTPIDTWLRAETTKLLLASLDTQRKARRAAAVLLWSAAAYLAIATVGQEETKRSTTQRLAGIEQQLKTEEGSLVAARQREASTFEEYIKTSNATEKLQGDALLSNKSTEIAKDVVSQKQKQTAVAQREHDATHSALDRANSELAAHRASRVPGDLRPDERLNQLSARVLDAQNTFEQAKEALNRAIAGENLATGVSTTPGSSPDSPVETGRAHLVALKDLQAGRLQRAHAENQWKLAQRQLESAEAMRDAARVEYDRLHREPNPMALPVLNLPVKPAHFFLAAPLILLILYWNVINHDRRLKNSASETLHQISERGLDSRHLTSTIPELEWTRMNWSLTCRMMLPDLATVAALTLLLWSEFDWIPACAFVATIVTILVRLSVDFAHGARPATDEAPQQLVEPVAAQVQ